MNSNITQDALYCLCFQSFQGKVSGMHFRYSVNTERYVTLTKEQLLLFHSLKGHSHLFRGTFRKKRVYWWDPYERLTEPEDDFSINQHLQDKVLLFLQQKNERYVLTFVVMDFYEIFNEEGDYDWLWRIPIYDNIVLTQAQYTLFCSHPGLVFEVPEHRCAQKDLYWELHHSRVLGPEENVEVDDDLQAQVLVQLVELENTK